MRFGRDSFQRRPANILFAQVSQVVYVRVEGPKALSPRQWIQAARPEGQKLLVQGNGYKQHALKGQKLLAQGNGYKQHALKGQKLLAQGNALGCLGR